MKALLARRGFRLLITSEAISATGDWLKTVALMVLVLDISGSSTAVAGILILRLAPSVFAAPLATRLTSRWDRRRVLLTMHLVRAGVVAIIPLTLSLWWIYICAFVVELCSLVFLPARDSVVPEVAGGEDDLPMANGLLLGSSYGTIPLGAAAFGLAAAATSAAGLGGRLAAGIPFWIDAATYLIAFALVARIHELGEGRTDEAAADDSARLRDAFGIPLVRQIAPAATAASLGIGALFSLGVVFVHEVLGASTWQFGVLIALFGIGAGAGLGVLQKVHVEHFSALRGAAMMQGAVVALMSLAPDISLAFLGAVLFGGAAAAALASGMSFLQAELAERDRVLAFVAFHVIIRLGLGLAAIAAGAVDDILARIELPLVGLVPATRVVLFSAGLVVVAGAVWARPGPRGAQVRTGPA